MKSPLIRPAFILSTLFLAGAVLLTAVFLSTPPTTSQAQATLTFSNQDNMPIDGLVRILCFDSPTAAAPFADYDAKVVNGQPNPPPPARCTHLAALHLRHEQPANKHDGLA